MPSSVSNRSDATCIARPEAWNACWKRIRLTASWSRSTPAWLCSEMLAEDWIVSSASRVVVRPETLLDTEKISAVGAVGEPAVGERIAQRDEIGRIARIGASACRSGRQPGGVTERNGEAGSGRPAEQRLAGGAVKRDAAGLDRVDGGGDGFGEIVEAGAEIPQMGERLCVARERAARERDRASRRR